MHTGAHTQEKWVGLNALMKNTKVVCVLQRRKKTSGLLCFNVECVCFNVECVCFNVECVCFNVERKPLV